MSYVGFETSKRQGEPVELYEFSYQANYFRFTSHAKPIPFGPLTYLTYPMVRSNLREQANSFEQPLTITAFKDFPPADFFRFQTPSAVMALAVRRKHILDDDTQYIVAWMGKVLGAKWVEDNEVILSCESDLSSMKRNALRRLYQRGCPWALYGAGCNLNPIDFAYPSTVFGVTGKTVNISSLAALAPNFFAGGYVEYDNVLTGIREYIAIRSSLDGDLNLSLVPLGLTGSLEIIAHPGCDHTIPTCDGKFGNRPNYGGQPSIPGVNPMGGKILY
jgi:uncharacterized phage protein (TIGR02218 family)